MVDGRRENNRRDWALLRPSKNRRASKEQEIRARRTMDGIKKLGDREKKIKARDEG